MHSSPSWHDSKTYKNPQQHWPGIFTSSPSARLSCFSICDSYKPSLWLNDFLQDGWFVSISVGELNPIESCDVKALFCILYSKLLLSLVILNDCNLFDFSISLPSIWALTVRCMHRDVPESFNVFTWDMEVLSRAFRSVSIAESLIVSPLSLKCSWGPNSSSDLEIKQVHIYKAGIIYMFTFVISFS